MSIYEEIQKQKLIMREDRAELSLIQSEICKDGKPMSDSDAIKVLTSMSKVCAKNIEEYSSRNLNEKVIEEGRFLGLIGLFLPAPATAEDVKCAIAELFGADHTPTMKDMGKVMGKLKQSFEVVDGNLVKSILLG